MTRGPWQDPELIRMLNGYMYTHVIDVALKLRLLEEIGRLLLPGAAGSVRVLADYLLDERSWHAWTELNSAVRTGAHAAEFAFGADYLDQRGWHPGTEYWEAVAALMTEHTRSIVPFVMDQYDFSAFSTAVDIGGGSGPFVAAVLAANPDMRGILFDREDGGSYARRVLDEAGVAERCEIRIGDFFESIPPGDLYLCKSVIFNWERDEQVATILANCRSSMTSPQSRLLLVEQMLPATVDGSAPPHLYIDDVGGTVEIGGRFRTEPEYRALLAATGFDVVVHPLPSAPEGFFLLEAAPV